MYEKHWETVVRELLMNSFGASAGYDFIGKCTMALLLFMSGNQSQCCLGHHLLPHALSDTHSIRKQNYITFFKTSVIKEKACALFMLVCSFAS